MAQWDKNNRKVSSTFLVRANQTSFHWQQLNSKHGKFLMVKENSSTKRFVKSCIRSIFHNTLFQKFAMSLLCNIVNKEHFKQILSTFSCILCNYLVQMKMNKYPCWHIFASELHCGILHIPHSILSSPAVQISRTLFWKRNQTNRLQRPLQQGSRKQEGLSWQKERQCVLPKPSHRLLINA